MSFDSITVPTTMAGNDIATEGTYLFPIRDSSYLVLKKVNDSTGVITTLTETTDYVVNGVGSDDSSDWTYDLTEPLATGYTIYAYPSIPFKQSDSFSQQTGIPPSTVEMALDQLVVRQKQQQYEIDRSLKVEIGSEEITPAELQEQLADAVSDTAGYASAASDSADAAAESATALSEAEGLYLKKSNNLSDITASTARTNLSVYSKAEIDAITKHHVKAYCSSNTISANTDIIFDVESADTGGYYDNTTGHFLPTVSGRWLITAQLSYTAGNLITGGLYLNGTIYAETKVRDSGDASVNYTISDIVLFNGTTDYLTVRSSANSSYVSNRSVRFSAVQL